MNKRQYLAATTEARQLADIDKMDITEEQRRRRDDLYQQIAKYERNNK